VARNDRVSLFLMDYVHRQRLKILGRIAVTDMKDDPELVAKLTVADYPARVERAMLITVEAFDWNCPQHITPRFTEAELADALAPIRHELTSLRAENERLRRTIDAGAESRPVSSA
jgi:uncharacterized protein